MEGNNLTRLGSPDPAAECLVQKAVELLAKVPYIDHPRALVSLVLFEAKKCGGTARKSHSGSLERMKLTRCH